MKLTAPHMGGVWPLLEDLFRRLDVDYVVPPPTTARTVRLGVQHSPEFACLPLKITTGNLIEGLEAGADTTIMAGGWGPCRFGYYADIQRRIIQGLGYEYQAITLEPAGAGLGQFGRTLKRIAPDKSYWQIWTAFRDSWPKAVAMDRLEKKALATRCFEAERGQTTRVLKTARAMVASAFEPAEIREAEAEALALFDGMPRREVGPGGVLKVGILGEFYIVLEPYFNFDVEEWLGERGVYVERAVYLTDWIGPGTKNQVGGASDEEIARWASPYLEHHVGGEGRKTVGHAAMYKHEGFDGCVHLMPFTCMPETIAKSILPKVSREEDLPYLTLVVDEQTGKAGVHTRLEAFLDLLRARRRAGLGLGGWPGASATSHEAERLLEEVRA